MIGDVQAWWKYIRPCFQSIPFVEKLSAFVVEVEYVR